MAGVVVETDVSVAARALGRLNETQLAQIMYEVGALIEDQTKLRIADDKTSPEGSPWEPWSQGYAASRSTRHSLLVGAGDLRDSIQNYSAGHEAIVGSPLIYAAPHQFGSPTQGIPARPFLGLSADNRTAIEDLVVGRIEDLLQ